MSEGVRQLAADIAAAIALIGIIPIIAFTLWAMVSGSERQESWDIPSLIVMAIGVLVSLAIEPRQPTDK